MADLERATDARFAAVVQALGRHPGVAHSATTSRLFGGTALKVYDKIFAIVSSEGHFVVKLPKARVDALVGNATGQRFQANRGRPMNEWLEVHSESSDWVELAREALDFVGT